VFFARFALVRPGPDETGNVPPWTYTFLLGWAGMRGVVTLAAAFVIPKDMEHREVLLLIAFTVTAGTLLIQGLSLPWLARLLRVPSPDAGADALARANLLHQASQAGLAELDRLEEEDPHDVSETIRERVRRRDYAAWERVNASSAETPSEIYGRRRKLMIDAERRRVLEIRSSGTVPHEVVAEVLAMLDVEESMLDYSEGERRRVRATVGGVTRDGGCDHLRDLTADVEPNTPGVCEECVRDGTQWVHLRLCLTCGHVGCCDSSPQRHATAHFHSDAHPVIRSAEAGETWRWCYVDELTA
jgi:CPA1 family monovalent cation:H+ antiporter